MSLREQYHTARSEAVAFLTAVNGKDADSAALIYEESADQGLLLWVMAQIHLGTLEAVAADHGWTVEDSLAALGRFNAENQA